MKIRQLSKIGASALVALLIVSAALVSFFVIKYQLGLDSGSQTSNSPSTSGQYSREELIAYVLSLINSDRQAANVPNLTLSSVGAAQVHANEMFKNGYFSHSDLEGYKPYVRYTLADGHGVVTENIAEQSGSSLDAKAAIRDLEWSMMNDDAGSNWEHRNNILDAFHNRVSIGIAYDDESCYLVQDFEDDYVEWTSLGASNGLAVLAGNITSSDLTIGQVDIYFDDWSNLTVTVLENPPYNGSYDIGTFVGSVSDSNLILTEGIFTTPEFWSQSGNSFKIDFSLSPFFSRWGKGIYTLRLWSDNGECLTNYSIFFSG